MSWSGSVLGFLVLVFVSRWFLSGGDGPVKGARL
jgi:hypothetical protein